jgi:hypothetical protein
MNNLTLLTLNCQKAYHPDFSNFLEQTLSSEKYDFILLQEVTVTIIAIITSATSSYKILNPFDSILEDTTGVCVLYKQEFALKDPFLLSFAKTYRKISPAAWGCVGGIFTREGEHCVIASVHLHAGIKMHIRMKELKLIKRMLDGYSHNNTMIVFGGDFNTGFPRELAIAKKIFSPLFVRTNKNLGTTLNSRYTEKAPFVLNKISIFLAKFGIGFTFRTDHFFIDTKTFDMKKISCAILPDRISDHNPVELLIR